MQVYQGPPVPPTKDWSKFPSVEPPAKFNLDQITHYMFERGPFRDDPFHRGARKKKPYAIGRFGIPECLNRDMQFLMSAQNIATLDQVRGGHYFVKAEMQASMTQAVHFVNVTISLRTGTVCDASCQPCKVTEMRRCNHICGVLLSIAGFGKESTKRGR